MNIKCNVTRDTTEVHTYFSHVFYLIVYCNILSGLAQFIAHISRATQKEGIVHAKQEIKYLSFSFYVILIPIESYNPYRDAKGR